MARRSDSELGAFEGVFAPSVLVGLGVVAHLRLPRALGAIGLAETIGLVLAAYVVGVITALAFAVIASDRSRGSGADHHLVSRSLGLPTGGTYALLSFVGLALLGGLGALGLAQSLLAALGLDPTDAWATRLLGAACLALVGALTIPGPRVAARLPAVAFALVALSFAAIVAGGGGAELDATLEASASPGRALDWLGALFPGVGGLAVGVSMAGRLREPERALPRGLVAATLVGLAVQLALAVFLALALDANALSRPRLLEEIAAFAPAVSVGLWAAALIGALACVVGAAHTLRAFASEGLGPRGLARSLAPPSPARNATLLSLAVAGTGVVVGDLDAVAALGSTALLAGFALVNTACALESLLDPDFRPSLVVPKTVSAIGAVGALALLALIGLGSAALAVLGTAGLYAYFQRAHFAHEAASAWDGLWSRVVRAGLQRLAGADESGRAWRPSVLSFRPAATPASRLLREIVRALTSGSGFVTDHRLRPRQATPTAPTEPLAGALEQPLTTDDPLATILSRARHGGIAGAVPNAVLLDWDALASEQTLATLLGELRALDLSVLALAPGEEVSGAEADAARRIDVWWREDGSPALGLALARLLSRTQTFAEAPVRLRTVTADPTSERGLAATALRLADDAHVIADVEVILERPGGRGLEHHARARSADAGLAIVELPHGTPDEASLAALRELAAALPATLFFGAGAPFRAMRFARDAEVQAGAPLRLELDLPEEPALARHVTRFADRLAEITDHYFREAIARAAQRDERLLDTMEVVAAQHAAIADAEPTASHAALLADCERAIRELVDQCLVDQRALLEVGARELLDDESLVDPEQVLVVERREADYAPGPIDSRELATFKEERRALAADGVVSEPIATAPIARPYAEEELVELALRVTRSYSRSSWRLGVALLASIGASHDPADEPTTSVESLRAAHRARVEALRAELADEARALAQRYADELAAIDLPLRDRSRDGRRAAALRAELSAAGGTHYERQRALLERAIVALEVSAFRHRLAQAVDDATTRIERELASGATPALRGLTETLRRYLEAADDAPLELAIAPRGIAFDAAGHLEALARETGRAAAELTEDVRTVDDDSLRRLGAGADDEIALVDLPLRRLCRFLVDAELIGPATERIAALPAAEAQGLAVVDEVERLIEFHQREHEAAGTTGTTDGRFAHMRPVVERSIARLESELAALEATSGEVRATLTRRLAAVLARTDAYELSRSAQALDHRVRREKGRQALSGVQAFALRVGEHLREALVGALYGRSAGILVARRLREEARDPGTSVERVRALVDALRPRQDVLEALPFHYRQLFLGAHAPGESFWVEREAETRAAERAVERHVRGARGLLVVHGEPGSGKSALTSRLLETALAGRPVFRLAQPEVADPSLDGLGRALREVSGRRGRPADVLASLPHEAVVVVEDGELYWQRSASGLAAIDALLEASGASGAPLVVLEIGTPALHALDRLRGLRDHALGVVECGPLPAAALRDVVMSRHASTGLRCELAGAGEQALTEWRVARLFNQHFAASGGRVGAALAGWVAHVERASEHALVVRAPARADAEALDGLRPDAAAALLALLLHKRLTRAQMLALAGSDRAAVDAPLDVLARMGLVDESVRGVLSIERFATPVVVDRLRARGVIA
ncbi:MAG: amino acid permease [Sandaracinaceae bacterium]|nr:amino acid permease [Sandaracinaceae bacterium]